MPKAKKLKSGSWNVRVTVQGKQYSFTDKDKKTALRMAAAFADECREAIDNPPLIDAIRNYIDDREDTCSPSTLRGYRSIEKTLRANYPALCQKRLVAVTDKDIAVLDHHNTRFNEPGRKLREHAVDVIDPAVL